MNVIAIFELVQRASALIQAIRSAIAAGQVTHPDGTVVTLEELEASIAAAQAEVLAAGDEAAARKAARAAGGD